MLYEFFFLKNRKTPAVIVLIADAEVSKMCGKGYCVGEIFNLNTQ